MAHFHHFSICNQNQSISIQVNFGHNTKAIAVLFGHKWLIFITFQSALKINQFQCWSFLAKMPRLQPYLFAKNGSFSSHFNLQSKSISFNLVMFGQNTKAIALLFGQNWLIFITFQSAIKINQFQCWSVLAKIPRLQPYFLAKNGSVSSLFNLKSNSINFNFGQFWPKYQGYSLTVWPKMAHFHHFSICTQSQSISILVIFGQNTKAIALLFGQQWLIFITFQSAININQFKFWSFLAKIPRLQPYVLAKTGSVSSLFNLQSNSINFNFGHLWPKYQGYSLTFWPKMDHFHHFSICNQNQSISIQANFGQNTKAIAVLFGHKWLIFITFQSEIKINQFQLWSLLAKIPRLQPYFLAKTGSVSSLFNLQSNSINFNVGHFWPKYQGYSLTFWPKMAHFHHFSICNQSKSINFNFGHVWPKYQGYSLTSWPTMAHFHHFSICNQHQSI